MTHEERKVLLKILGYTGREKTASALSAINGLQKKVKRVGIGAGIGATMGLAKSQKNFDPNADIDNKVYNTVAPTVGGAILGSIGGNIVNNGLKAAKKIPFLKASEFIDELSLIKLSAMTVPSDEEIEEMNNKGNNIVEGNGYVETSRPDYESLQPLNREPIMQNRVVDEGIVGGV